MINDVHFQIKLRFELDEILHNWYLRNSKHKLNQHLGHYGVFVFVSFLVHGQQQKIGIPKYINKHILKKQKHFFHNLAI